MPVVDTQAGATTVSEAPRLRIEILLAGLLLDSGELSRAQAAYDALLREAPENGDVHAGLGTISLQRGARDEARERWTRALALGRHADTGPPGI